MAFHARADASSFLCSASFFFFSAAFLRSLTAFSAARFLDFSSDLRFEMRAFSARARSFLRFSSSCFLVGLGFLGGPLGLGFVFSPSASSLKPSSSRSRPSSFLGLALPPLPLAAGLAAVVSAGVAASAALGLPAALGGFSAGLGFSALGFSASLGFSIALGLAAGGGLSARLGGPRLGSSFFALGSGGSPRASRDKPNSAQSIALGSFAGGAGGAPLA